MRNFLNNGTSIKTSIFFLSETINCENAVIVAILVFLLSISVIEILLLFSPTRYDPEKLSCRRICRSGLVHI